jgi:hypothetical protein
MHVVYAPSLCIDCNHVRQVAAEGRLPSAPVMNQFALRRALQP